MTRAERRPPEGHAPKTAALIAYHEGLLSHDGRRRLEAHLGGCDVCRRELASIELYEGLVDDARAQDVPAIDFDRMELALAREAKQTVKRANVRDSFVRWAPWVAAAVAAAAILFVYLGDPVSSPTAARPGASHALGPASHETPTAPAVEPPEFVSASVTLASGTVIGGQGSAVRPLAAGDTLEELETITTGADGRAHAQVASTGGFALAANSELSLDFLRVDEVRLGLRSGEMSNHVGSFEAGARYVVLAAQYRVSAEGTRFAVRIEDLDAPVVAVDVLEGEVQIETPQGESIVLTSPARWRSDGAAPQGEPAVEALRDRGTAETSGILLLPADRMARWSVDELEFETTGASTFFVERGEHEVRGWDSAGRLHRAMVTVGETGFVDEGALVAEAPRIRPGHLEPSEISQVVVRGQRNLQRCYERALRRPGAAIRGGMSLRVRIDALGGVDRVNVSGLDGVGAEQLGTCIENYVGRWTFPPPGGPLTLSIPVNLAPR